MKATTNAEQWLMPLFDAELSDFIGSTLFASINFGSRYWQSPLDPNSFGAWGIVSPQGAFASTRVLHDLKNASAYFQSTVSELFDSMGHPIKNWFEDFTIHKSKEEMILYYLDELFEICPKHHLSLSTKSSVFQIKKVNRGGSIIKSQIHQLDP